MTLDDILKQVEDFFTPTQKVVEEEVVQPKMEVVDTSAFNTIPYYPKQSYVEGKGRLPEHTLTEKDINLVSASTRKAVDEGIISPEVAKYVIPMLMVEGRPGNYGVKSDQAIYASPRNKAIMEKLGLSMMKQEDIREGDKPNLVIQQITPKGQSKPEPHIVINMDTLRGADVNAKMVAALLGIKSSLKGVNTPEDVVKRYNGKGKAIEIDDDGKKVPANTETYLKKVQEAKRMLDHPKNERLKQYYDALLNGRK